MAVELTLEQTMAIVRTFGGLAYVRAAASNHKKMSIQKWPREQLLKTDPALAGITLDDLTKVQSQERPLAVNESGTLMFDPSVLLALHSKLVTDRSKASKVIGI